MLYNKELTEEQARRAIECGEFREVAAEAENVAVVMTQDWCPDWIRMKVWTESWEKKGKPSGNDVVVYRIIYNTVPYRKEFMAFKETTLGNRNIPYIRYYKNGEFIGDSNGVSAAAFLERFGISE
ncbi:MAG: hypothetical protein EA426_10035 [Spirochaetaceae bacterium]|nr:MAG: hypothetical protein EA426_10035 [Spirochaetaceae bacterium]